MPEGEICFSQYGLYKCSFLAGAQPSGVSTSSVPGAQSMNDALSQKCWSPSTDALGMTTVLFSCVTFAIYVQPVNTLASAEVFGRFTGI